MALSEFVQSWEAGGRAGREKRTRRTLSEYMQPALGGDQVAQQAIYSADPDIGFQVQDQARQMGKSARDEFGEFSRLYASAPEPIRQQMYPGWRKRAIDAGLPADMPDAYDPQSIQIAQAAAGAGLGGSVQSTYIDAQGNRVAIMRDGKTAVLGQNAPNNQIIDTGNGFFGVNKGNLSAAPVTVGGAPQPQGIGPGTYQTPNGIVRIGDLPPEMQQAALADIQAGGTSTNVQLPPRDVVPAQSGQQLRSAPKPQDGQFQTLSSQEVVGLGLPQGTIAQRSPTGQVQIINKPRDLPTGGQVIDNGDGTTTYIPAGKITEGERNASGFYERMVAANAEMDRLLKSGYDPTDRRDFYTAGGELLNPLASSEGQQYRQAQENWVRANLRKESGAAIGVAEMDQERKNYFPIPGDSREVIAQKARNRQVTERAMRQAAGGGLAPPGTPGSKQTAAGNSPKRARNPQTGQVLVLLNGQWVPE